MSAYSGPIVKNGVVIPMLFLLVLIGGIAYGLSKIKTEGAAREKIYGEYLIRVKNANLLESQLKPGRDRQKKMVELLKAEIKPAISKYLGESMTRYKDKDYELQQVSMKHIEDRGAVGNMVQANLSKVQMTFRGGYGPMQETLFDLESQMPQLQMEKIVIARTKSFGVNQREALTFNVDYIAWKW